MMIQPEWPNLRKINTEKGTSEYVGTALHLGGDALLSSLGRRIHHAAGSQWGNKKYMCMKHLKATAHDAFIAG